MSKFIPLTGTYFKSEELETDDYLAFFQEHKLSAYPVSNYVPMMNSYKDQDDLTNAKKFLLRRLIQSGFPHEGIIVKPSGVAVSVPPAKNVFRNILFSNKDVSNSPSGSSSVIINEILRIGKVTNLPLSHITLSNSEEPFIANTVIITDTYQQLIKGLHITFVTCYAHIKNFPKYWYTQITLFIYNNKLVLFPTEITANKTVNLYKYGNFLRNVTFDIEALDFFFGTLAGGIIFSDPIWTLDENIFELQAPYWFSRFFKRLDTIFNEFKVDESDSNKPIIFLISKCIDDKIYTPVVTSYWIVLNKDNGYFNGYTFNKETNKVVYGLFQRKKINNEIVSDLIDVLEEKSIEDTSNIKDLASDNRIFRPGFKTISESCSTIEIFNRASISTATID